MKKINGNIIKRKRLEFFDRLSINSRRVNVESGN
jgi:hypothetical protein